MNLKEVYMDYGHKVVNLISISLSRIDIDSMYMCVFCRKVVLSIVWMDDKKGRKKLGEYRRGIFVMNVEKYCTCQRLR